MSDIPAPITIVDMIAASPSLLEAIEASFDPASALFNIPATPAGLRNLRSALRNGGLPDATQKRIALAIGSSDSHTYRRSRDFGLGQRHHDQGRQIDAKAQAAVSLAVKIAKCDGHVDEADLTPAKCAGFCASELLEIVGHVALNNLTIYINHLFATGDPVPVAQAARVA